MPPHGNRKRRHSKDYTKWDQSGERARVIFRPRCVVDLDRHDVRCFIAVRRRYCCVNRSGRRPLYTPASTVANRISLRFDFSLSTDSRKRDRWLSLRRQSKRRALFLRIDGTLALPYKPPQLSDILPRRQQCGVGQRYCFLIGCDPGIILALLREEGREADLSTEQAGAQAPSWLPHPDGYSGRSQGAQCSPGAGPQAAQRVTAQLPLYPPRQAGKGYSRCLPCLPLRVGWR